LDPQKKFKWQTANGKINAELPFEIQFWEIPFAVCSLPFAI
jgi:hypothetical protein